MLKDTTETVVIGSGKIIVLDLDGHNITAPIDKNYDAIANNGKLTIRDSKKNGKIISEKNHGISVNSNSNTTIEYANIQGQEGAVCGYNTTNGAEVTIIDGVFTGKDNAVVIFNGSDRDGEANKVTINGGIFNGEIQSEGYIACGIYAPWKDKITVNGGTFNITGGAGIVARAGNVTITGGEFKTTANNTTVEKGIGKVGDSGVLVPCFALVFDSKADYPALTPDSKIDVRGGKFISEVDTVSFIKKDNDNNRIVISGGTFSSDVNKYCVKNYVTEKNDSNTYTVKPLKDVAVAQIGENSFYRTINEAVDALNISDTITLLKDTFEDVTVTSGKNITLDLNGKKLTNLASDTITVENNAELTITGDGTVDNVTHAMAAISNNGKCTLNGGTFTRSKENGITADNNGGNSFYTILNHGIMNINDGVNVKQNGHYSSLLENGYQSVNSGNQRTGYVENINVQDPTLTVEGGVFDGGLNTIKNDDNGIANIKNGTLKNYTQSAFQNHHIATIKGGIFDGADVYAVLNCGVSNCSVNNSDKHETTIIGGKFNGAISRTVGKITISGGYFTSDPTEYLTEGKVAGLSDIDGYKYKVVTPRHSSSGSSTTTYTVTVGSVSNGTVTSSHKSAASGATVTLTVKPADGYAVEAVTAKDAKGNAVKVTEKDGKYTFAMPASNVTVSASFVKKGEQPAAKLFDDVAQGAYYYDAVKWAVDKGVTNGKTSNLFGADDPCTRAQIVTFLWRAAGSPAASASVSFTDVKDSDYYAKAVAWAVEKGITNGTGDGKFSSDDTCTRAQCAAFLYRAAGSPEVTDAAAFSDVAADAYYAKAVAWAEKNGITNGLGNGKFGSDNSCTRAQIITFLYRTYQGK